MSVIYGYIESSASNDQELHIFNTEVLKQLPYNGAYICRDMFAVLPYNNRSTSKYSHLIHFAAEYNNEYVMPPEWVIQFEALLSKLSWHYACAIITYSGHRFEWQALYNTENMHQVKARPVQHRCAYDSYHNLDEVEFDKLIS